MEVAGLPGEIETEEQQAVPVGQSSEAQQGVSITSGVPVD